MMSRKSTAMSSVTQLKALLLVSHFGL